MAKYVIVKEESFVSSTGYSWFAYRKILGMWGFFTLILDSCSNTSSFDCEQKLIDSLDKKKSLKDIREVEIK